MRCAKAKGTCIAGEIRAHYSGCLIDFETCLLGFDKNFINVLYIV